MPSKLNSEFNYRYQVIGDTPWEKIKTLKGFLEGRRRAACMEPISAKRRLARELELQHAKDNNALPHVILNLESEILEAQAVDNEQAEAWELNRQEIRCIEKLLEELYEIAEPTRIPGYSDQDMFEANAAYEFTIMIGKEIQAEIIANGRPSPARLKNAMSNPYTFETLKRVGLIPQDAVLLDSDSNNPLAIAYQEVVAEKQGLRIENNPT
jgi:hypothetical protein